MQKGDSISDRVYPPSIGSGEENTLRHHIDQGREQILGTGEPEADALQTEVEQLTTNPLEGKEKVETYLFKHPEESGTSKFFQSKPGRILKPLGRTFQIGGYAAGVSGIGVGLLIGLPGFLFAGAGLGIGKIGDKLVKKSVERRKNVRDELISRLGKENIPLSSDIRKWGRGEGSKSLQRLKFEVLESEIKDSSVITDKDKVTLLKMFSDKKVGSKEYKILLSQFEEFKKKNADYHIMEKILADEERKGVSKAGVMEDVSRLVADYNENKIDDLSYYGQLVDLIHKYGKEEYKEEAKRLANEGMFSDDIFTKLANPEVTENDNLERSQANFMHSILGVSAGSKSAVSEQIEEIEEGNEIQEIDEHHATSLLKTDDADPGLIEEETKEPLTAKEKVKQYLSNDPEQGVDLHPKETLASKIFQRKPDRVLKPLGQTFQGAGMVGGIVGAGTALLIGLPGVLVAGLGAGSVYLGNKIVQKTKDRRNHEANELEGRLTSADSKLVEDISEWRRGGGEKSLQRLRFEVLEAEIKNSSAITKKDKSTLLQMFADKKVGHKEYKILLESFEKFKKKSSDFQEIMREMLPKNVNQAVMEDIKNIIAKHNRHNNDEDFYGELVQVIRNHGNADFQESVEDYEKTLSPAGVFKKLTIPLKDSDYKQVIKMLPENVSQDVKNEVIDLVYTREEKTDNDFYKELLDLIIAHGNDNSQKAAKEFMEVGEAVNGQNYAAFFKISAMTEESISQTSMLSNIVGLDFKG